MTNNQNVVRQPENPTKKRAAAYVRVSTQEQTHKLQIHDLTGYAERENLELEWFDEKVSGAKKTRPVLERMMDEVRRKKFVMVIVWKFDRFARNTAHMVQALEEFKSLGVDFFSYKEPAFDTRTPMGLAMFQIAAVFAELERNQARERSMAGQQAARARGKHIGRPQRYYVNELDEVWDRKDKPARHLGKLSNDSSRKAAERLGLPRSTIQRLRAGPKDPPQKPGGN